MPYGQWILNFIDRSTDTIFHTFLAERSRKWPVDWRRARASTGSNRDTTERTLVRVTNLDLIQISRGNDFRMT